MVFRHKKSTSGSSANAANPRSRIGTGNDPEKSIPADTNPLARRFVADDEPDTIDLEPAVEFPDAGVEDQDVPTTRTLCDEAGDADRVENITPPNSVTGFLVIISGPERGSILMLRYGNNVIGYDASQRLSLDQEDKPESHESLCLVTYDRVTRKFYLQPGEGNNPTCLEGQPVLAGTELVAGNHIRVGETELRFIPLCGKDFDWKE